MITKKDLQEMFLGADTKWDKRFNEADTKWDKRFTSLRKELKDDIETAVAQVIEFVMKYSASKEDLKEVKEEVKEVKEEIVEVKADVKDIKRQINDLKADTPTPAEFANHEKRITKLEAAAFPA